MKLYAVRRGPERSGTVRSGRVRRGFIGKSLWSGMERRGGVGSGQFRYVLVWYGLLTKEN